MSWRWWYGRHPLPAATAEREALQQRGPFARGAGGSVRAVRIGVGGKCLLVLLVLLEGDVSRVRVTDQCPLIARHRGGRRFACRGLAGPALTIYERAGIARVVQRAQHP